MEQTVDHDWLVSIRRDLHRRPEPGWCEFYTTARILEELETMGVDDVLVGREMLATDTREAVPDDETLTRWLDRARGTDADRAVLDRLAGGYTGAMATIDRGPGPTVALRVDIDGLPRRESDEPDHVPTAEGFRSVNEGHMHACGHDAHASIGLGVLQALGNTEFGGTLKVLFQPAEERIGGAKPVAQSGHLDDVDALIAVHVGLDHPTGEIVAGIDGFLAITSFEATFEGEGAHAGGHPNRGHNAVQAMATAVQNLYGIPRHEDGTTRINAGKVAGGTASNIVPEDALIEGEVRGETTGLMEYMREEAYRVIEGAGEVHNCRVTIDQGPDAPSARSDQQVVRRVASAGEANDRVENVRRRDELGGSEDATYLLNRVQKQGGIAGYVGIGTDHPGGHHTATFDIDEDSLLIGVEVLSDSLIRLLETVEPGAT